MRAIDADAMLARLEEWNTSDPTDKALYNFTLNRILEQPTIERTGKWIAISKANPTASGFGMSISYLYKCDMCGCLSKTRTLYCSMCGAKMDTGRRKSDDKSQ